MSSVGQVVLQGRSKEFGSAMRRPISVSRASVIAAVFLMSMVDLGSNLQVGHTRIGFLQWLLLLAICIFGLLFAGVSKKALRNALPFVVVTAYYAVNSLRADNLAYAAVDVTYIAIPVALYLVVYRVASREGRSAWVHRLLMSSIAMPVFILVLSAMLGLFTYIAGEGFGSLLGMRSVSLYTTMVAAVGVGWMSRGGSNRKMVGVLPALCFGCALAVALITLSRTSLLVLAILAASIAVGTLSARRLLIGISTIALLVTFAITYEPLRSRLIPDTSNGFEEAITSGQFSSGRFLIWALVFENAMKSPYIGQGTGDSKVLVYGTYPDAAMLPHNEFLRLWHDGGLIGATLFFGPLMMRARRYRRCETRMLKDGSPVQIYSLRAARLVIMAMLIAAIFDNVFLYVFLSGILFCAVACADSALDAWDQKSATHGRNRRMPQSQLNCLREK